MSASGFSPIQTGVFALLNGDATLTNLIDGVFDSIPSDKKYVKYIVLGAEGTETPFRTFGPRSSIPSARGHENKFVVHIWTKDNETSAGSKLAQQVIDQVTELMENGSLVVANHGVVMCQLEFSEIMESMDNLTNELWRHGVARYDVIAQDSV